MGGDADWWPMLARRLGELQREPGYVQTPTGVKNYILRVDEREGVVVLRSEQSRSGNPRTITLGMLRSAPRATRHGVILRAIRDLVDPPRTGWTGPFPLRRLVEHCIDPEQPWPPADGILYFVSRRIWDGTPSPACEPLYVGGLTGRSERMTTRVGDLVADLLGFFGGGTGHHSGGQRLYEWCLEHAVHPLELHVGWLEDPAACRRCTEVEWNARLTPAFNAVAPPACRDHGPTPRQRWEMIWGAAGAGQTDEFTMDPDPALERASRER